ncbi:hypothetical protein [Azospirillum argentinense]|uniref:Uncharacterized protein n=1 Tax=Azospirillum argentinense TaxID=2970906 RepID=A0A5B0KPD0_9PROT|nr:hypothetical protein [Azospirillum argentinense]KAA1053805.1 hypothetical protein FH063_002387 [Azospirillum argentinense]
MMIERIGILIVALIAAPTGWAMAEGWLVCAAVGWALIGSTIALGSILIRRSGRPRPVPLVLVP